MKITLPYLTYQGNTPIYRRRIPATVRAAFGGQHEVFADLTLNSALLQHPSDIRKAATLKRIVALVGAEFECALARARAGIQVGRFDRAVFEIAIAKALLPVTTELDVEGSLPMALRALREDDIELLAERYKCLHLVADNEVRFGEEGAIKVPMTLDEHRDYKSLISEAVAQLREAQAIGDTSIVRETVAEVLAAEGFSDSIADDLFQRLQRRFLAVDVEAAQLQLQRANGDSIDNPKLPELDDESLMLATLVENWQLVRSPGIKTAIEARAAIRLFETWCIERHQRVLSVNRLVIEDIAAFRDWLLVHVPKRNQKTGAALHPASVRKYLGLLTAIVNSFMCDRTVSFKNVFADVKRPQQERGKGRPRTAFRAEQLVHLFAHPQYLALRDSADAWERTVFWFMPLGLFTGARLGEIGQLLVRDMVCFDDKTFFYFCDEASGQQLKTSSAEGDARIGAHHVPVHEVLIRMGFLDYVAAQKSRVGLGGQLFDSLSPDSHGVLTGGMSKRLNHFLDDVGLDDRRLTFHSFRHTFKHFARMCGLNEAVVDQLVGHKSGEVGAGYGGDHYPIEPLLEGMRKYQLPFLDFAPFYTSSTASSTDKETF